MSLLLFGKNGYINKVLNADAASGYDPSSLIGFWPQNEASGGVSYDHSGLGHHGAYTGVTLGQPGVPGMGMTSPLYDGANDFNNVWSVALAAAFNGGELTFMGFMKVSGAGVWTDGTVDYLWYLRADGNNRYYLAKTAANNTLLFQYVGGGTAKAVTRAPISDTGWIPWAFTVSESADEFKAYLYGTQTGITQTGLGAWVGNLDNTFTVIGAQNTAPASLWHGWIGPALLYTTALDQPAIAYLSTP